MEVKHDVFTLYFSICDKSYICHFKILSQPVICESVLPTMIAAHLKELIDYRIPVNDYYEGPIEILVEADHYKSIPCGLTAIETRLGRTIMGRISQISSEESEILVAN